ncbi:inactive hydroxysteroid dehydrogenase-like protein 1 [Python bivittatus]|uniref:Inactive hydroxysteroid dehydrogenase-like protein 1 n=1 Tax=Python bivittatus TaxID=176946 RepID=A0A9F5N155_PYTBI|nr:inactive hydroxysteroid dehydrogenase-like protein 1 [Python bivittatus]XP_025031878.1 inactive hydroxysteroid dehydrogenase-like protein 1 [Python bivittatus]XP_025031879.1 inactive hydroxysteroid dehydrogenase-like protein 1 [Python bivittatus]XP_025031881.1 inactive hydroxysteroid dehydrogenase-like protein 1 [Python bivittatus]XP_025031882.1 inactive hydroxysteroid dehydrogenase-like protein 1 [Python bivittatus]
MAAVDSFSLLLREIGRSYNYGIEMLAVIGAFYATKVCVTILNDTYVLIRVHFVPRIFGRPDLSKQYGKWAVVTGGTSSLGISYAKELASRGVDLILISRNREKLEAVAKEIVETYNIRTAIVVTDFSRGREAYPALKKALEGKEIGVLVNNVGVLYPLPDSFTSLTEAQVWEFINVNIGAANMMVHLVLPGMVQRKKGAIVNVSSISCCKPCPRYTAYSASKTYLDHFSRSLHYEYASHGIFIQSLIPFFICTNVTTCRNTLSKTGFFVPSSDEYVRHAVTTLGVSRRTTGYWPHTLLMILARFVPEWIWAWVVSRIKYGQKSL